METFGTLLRGSTYPGRGIILGTDRRGFPAAAYFIMGRSENSRNRIFDELADGGIRTLPRIPEKVKDPSLIIYRPVRTADGYTIVTNGDQTDTIYDALKLGGSFESALRTRTYEPDGPNYTPRISGVIAPDGSYKLSLLKKSPYGTQTERFFFEYGPEPRLGHMIHTYVSDGSPLPSYRGEPAAGAISGDIDEFAGELWDALDKDNKISLFVRFIDPESGGCETRIINKYGR